jgi:hypothetical protein
MENQDKTATLILSAIVVFGFGGVLMIWMMFPPTSHSDVLSALVGALAAGYLQVINYWFQRPKQTP